MKKHLYLLPALALILTVGCTPKQEPEDTPPPPETPASSPEPAKEVVTEYGQGLVSSMDKARSVQAKEDIREVQRAIQEYTVTNGSYPPSLDSIAGNITGNINLNAFSYDPATGIVGIK